MHSACALLRPNLDCWTWSNPLGAFAVFSPANKYTKKTHHYHLTIICKLEMSISMSNTYVGETLVGETPTSQLTFLLCVANVALLVLLCFALLALLRFALRLMRRVALLCFAGLACFTYHLPGRNRGFAQPLQLNHFVLSCWSAS